MIIALFWNYLTGTNKTLTQNTENPRPLSRSDNPEVKPHYSTNTLSSAKKTIKENIPTVNLLLQYRTQVIYQATH
jgi:hypothetical protein